MTKSKKKNAPDGEGFSLISNSKLLALYAAMVQTRTVAQQSRTQLPRQRAPRSVESILGHEAAVAGAAIDLKAHDTLVPTVWPDSALKAINSNVSVAPTLPAAIRAALAEKNNQKITLLFSSAKPSAQPAWINALTVAAENSLPFLFVALDRFPGEESSFNPANIPVNRKGYNLPVIPVDGHDVVAVYRVSTESMTYARKGYGPTVIDCRLSTTGDPLTNMETYLSLKGLKPARLQ